MLDLIIIGSGPFGISLAAHAVANKLSYKLLGYPMDFWKNKMPQDMFIRTPHDFVSFSDAHDQYTIHRFAEDTGIDLVTPLPRPIFVQYALWFAEKTGVEFTPELATKVSRAENIFTVVTENGQILKARNLIVATGVEHYKHIPEMFKNIPSQYLSHTSGYTNFASFKEKEVIVLGSGQSAWEAAALLHRDGAKVELIYRRETANYAGSREAEIFIRDLGDTFFHLPIEEKKQAWGQAPGSIAHFLRPYVEGLVPETGAIEVLHAEVKHNKVELVLSNGETRKVDHLISASGFKINVDRVPFFESQILEQLEREEGFAQFPKLDENFQANIPGLFFAGPLSSHSHGPTFRFILGLRRNSFAIMSALVQQKQRVEIIN